MEATSHRPTFVYVWPITKAGTAESSPANSFRRLRVHIRFIIPRGTCCENLYFVLDIFFDIPHLLSLVTLFVRRTHSIVGLYAMTTSFGEMPSGPPACSSSPVPKFPRKQVHRACEWCRARRIKCDNGHPCRNCRARRANCTNSGPRDVRTLPQALQ
jgi:hypothetical protein